MMRARRRGFTLVEMLVAISLLGLLGVISWRGLDHVVDQRARISRQDAQIERLIRTIAQIERDVDERLADTLFAGLSSPSATLPRALAIDFDKQARQRLMVVRRHPDGTGTVTVSYQLDGSDLVRFVALTSRGETDRVVMLRDISDFRSRLLSQGGWVDARGFAGSPALAIEIVIEGVDGGRYTKVMPL